MKKSFLLFWFLSVAAILILPLTISEAREDTAHLSLVKTATPGNTTQKYVVQQGDNIDKIVQKFIGGSSHRYTLIKQLNPELKNLHRIYPGQTIILPVIEAETKEAVPPKPLHDEKFKAYRVKKGDSITHILHHQLNVEEEDIPKTLKLVRKMNPGLSNLNRIQIGQTIMLPATSVMASAENLPSDKQANENSKKKAEMKPLLPAEKELNLLKQLINRSHGSMISRGNYFIPLPEMGRMTIDCSTIPVVEFDDGSTVLLDFSDRIPKSLQKLIETNWKNYHILKVRPSQNTYVIFQETINASSSYTLKKGIKPFLLEKEPQVLISLDWLITSKYSTANKPYFHGILLASDKTQLLPVQIKQYAEGKGLQLTEIQNGEISFNSPSVKYPPALELPSISADKPMDLIFNLLVKFGYSPLKDQELKLNDTSGNGFNLSVKPDILLKVGQREILISSKKLPPPLMEALSQQKKEVHVIDARVSKKTALSQILSALHFPTSVGRYAFYIAEKGHKAKITITLPAVKIERKDGPLYLIDYDLDRNLYTLLHENWKAEIIRY